ncbi:nucleophile aminohydrolase [Lactifluus subvellereus]|nr:nucleophile aminohydrolase [Lactifluus subvellereus]
MSEDLTTPAPLTPFYVVAAHGGAGYHPPSSDSSIKRSLRVALSSAIATFSKDATGATVTPAAGHSSSSYNTSGTSSGSSALDTATTLIAALEDDPEFNAGYGSNLTFDGDVECDAALMDGGGGGGGGGGQQHDGGLDSDPDPDASCSSFGSVGAVRGVRNPVMLARRVLDERRRRQQRRLLSSSSSSTGIMDRVPPLLLVGEGAARFAGEVGVRVVRDPSEMVAPRARREWCVWKGRWEEEEAEERRRRHAQATADAAVVVVGPQAGVHPQAISGCCDVGAGVGAGAGGDPLRARQDTVGAVVLVGGDARDAEVSAGVSSGGLLLKPSGRIGEAAVFGAGCWAERLAGGGRSVACSVSGQGELIVQSSLAKALAERIAAAATADGDTHDILQSVLVHQFYGKWHRQGEYQPEVGVLLLTQDVDGDEGTTTRLWCAFTTQSMAVAYASTRHPKPKVRHPPVIRSCQS